MATSGGGSIASGTLRRSFRRWKTERDPKKLGVLGAPQCRCTPLVLALCVALTGLVTVGVGACMAAFMWHDETPKALGLALVGLGAAMIIAGGGLFIYDSHVRSLMPRPNTDVAYTYQEGTSHLPPSNARAPAVVRGAQTISTITNVHAMPSNGNHSRRPHMHHDPAPPTYDAVLEEDVRYRSPQVVQQEILPSINGRGSYHSTVRDARHTATTSSVV